MPKSFRSGCTAGGPSPHGGAFDALVLGIADRQFDAVSFTSAPAVAAMLMRARELGVETKLLDALRNGVHAMCVGPVTARPLVRLGVPTSAPVRMRLGALARHITDELPLLQSRTLIAAGHQVEIRGNCVLVDGAVKSLSPAAMATMRALAHSAGHCGVSARSAGHAARCRQRHARGRDRRTALTNRVGRQEHRRDGRQARLPTRSGRRVPYELLLVAHGTRKPDGVSMIGELAERVGPLMDRRSRWRSSTWWAPRPVTVLATLDHRPVVLVPAFLSAATTSASDIPMHVAASGHSDVTVTPALGPCPQMVRVIADRLCESGWRPEIPSFSRQPVRRIRTPNATCASPRPTLSAAIGRRVELAYAATGEPRVDDAVTSLRRAGARRVVVASYLLAEGLFQDRLRASGADIVTDRSGCTPARCG